MSVAASQVIGAATAPNPEINLTPTDLTNPGFEAPITTTTPAKHHDFGHHDHGSADNFHDPRGCDYRTSGDNCSACHYSPTDDHRPTRHHRSDGKLQQCGRSRLSWPDQRATRFARGGRLRLQC